MSCRCTAISAMKLWDFQRLQGLKEVYYESVTLSIWSMTEVSMGIVVANLPPLRKSFDRLLKHVLPKFSTNRSTSSRFPSVHLPTYHSNHDPGATAEGVTGRGARLHSMTTVTGDHESDKAILENVYLGKGNDRRDIMCTTHISVEKSR
jgi:hypothetical protein